MAAIRSVTDIPIVPHIWTSDSYGGANLLYDAPEVAKVYVLCYFKFEPAPAPGYYAQFNSVEGSGTIRFAIDKGDARH